MTIYKHWISYSSSNMKKVNLSEESYNKLKKKLVREATVGEAYDDIRTSFEDLWATLNNAIIESNESNYDEEPSYNPYLLKIKEYVEPVYDMLNQEIQ